MDAAASDELIGELLDLTRRLRGQLARHAALGTWAAPGGASARISEAMDGEAELDAGAPLHMDAVAGERDPGGPRTAPGPHAPHVGTQEAGGDTAAGAWRAGARDSDTAADPRTAPGPAAAPPHDPHVGTHESGDTAAGAWRAEARDAAADPSTVPGPMAAPPHDFHVGAAGPGEPTPGSAIEEAPVVLGRRALPQIRAELGDCTRCKLHSTRRSIVFGVGAADTPLMFVGEAPGEQEDRRGEPFVGPAGQLLDKMIEAMGWTRAAVYIANTTKCRPPGNRNPQPDELAQCMPFLHAQISAIAPRIIVALGRPAANQLLGNDAPISALRGRFHDYALPSGGVRLKIMPTFHPAYLLRDPSKKRTAWEDLKLVMAELERLGIAPPAAPRG
jgi:uracil-DNA glycosylase family 4